MTGVAQAAALEQRLRPLADAARAAPMAAYLLGQFPFLGLPAPVRRAAVRDLIAQPLPDAEALLAVAQCLWRLPEREFRYTAIDLLRQQVRLLRPAHLGRIGDLLLHQPWWETVDGLAAVVGAVMRRHRQEQTLMDDWVRHGSMWMRRAAMLHQLGWRLETDRARLGDYALLLAHENAFFIKKAIGWSLRDYARWDPEFVRHFVHANRQLLSPLTVREACKRLPHHG